MPVDVAYFTPAQIATVKALIKDLGPNVFTVGD